MVKILLKMRAIARRKGWGPEGQVLILSAFLIVFSCGVRAETPACNNENLSLRQVSDFLREWRGYKIFPSINCVKRVGRNLSYEQKFIMAFSFLKIYSESKDLFLTEDYYYWRRVFIYSIGAYLHKTNDYSRYSAYIIYLIEVIEGSSRVPINPGVAIEDPETLNRDAIDLSRCLVDFDDLSEPIEEIKEKVGFNSCMTGAEYE